MMTCTFDSKTLTIQDSVGNLTNLVKRYDEPHRFYHTRQHLLDMLTHPEDIYTDRLRLAIVAHDAVYDTHRCDNEEQSARLVPEIADLIMVTKHHNPVTAEECILCDLDLGILASEDYDTYAANIRKEYAWVPDDVYRVERAKVLRKFLKPVYHAGLYSNLAAWENIERELEHLDKRTEPWYN